MKQVLFFIFCLLVLGVSAQTLHVEAHENNLSSSDLWTEMVTEIKVENISQSNTVEVKVSKEIIVAPANTTNYFCWVNCFLAQTIVSPTQITFAPGDVDEINLSHLFGPDAIIAQLLKTEILNNKNIEFNLNVSAANVYNNFNFISLNTLI